MSLRNSRHTGTTLARRGLLAGAAAALLAPGRASADAWPARPIRFVVSLAPGSIADLIARLLAQPLSAALGQPLVVDNRPGAGGTLAGDTVAKAPADGHTIGLLTVQSHAVAPAVYAHVPYDPVRDFTHLALVAEIPLVLAVSAAGPVRTLEEFIALARRTPGGLRVGTNGNGSSAHVTIERFRRLAGIELTHVPYRGSNVPAITDLIAGRLEAIVPSLADVARNDRVRLLAASAPERLAGWPEVPTFREQGFPDLVSSVWISVAGPAGLPDVVADRLHAEIQAALARPEVAARLAEIGSGPNRGLSRAALTAYVAQEGARWGELARAANIRAE
jgi:tripartite-type tricarboxylate transporter receptor subunit TctC